jgi:hypothetical protein
MQAFRQAEAHSREPVLLDQRTQNGSDLLRLSTTGAITLKVAISQPPSTHTPTSTDKGSGYPRLLRSSLTRVGDGIVSIPVSTT